MMYVYRAERRATVISGSSHVFLLRTIWTILRAYYLRQDSAQLQAAANIWKMCS